MMNKEKYIQKLAADYEKLTQIEQYESTQTNTEMKVAVMHAKATTAIALMIATEKGEEE